MITKTCGINLKLLVLFAWSQLLLVLPHIAIAEVVPIEIVPHSISPNSVHRWWKYNLYMRVRNTSNIAIYINEKTSLEMYRSVGDKEPFYAVSLAHPLQLEPNEEGGLLFERKRINPDSYPEPYRSRIH